MAGRFQECVSPPTFLFLFGCCVFGCFVPFCLCVWVVAGWVCILGDWSLMTCSTYKQYYVENRNIQLNAKYVDGIIR